MVLAFIENVHERAEGFFYTSVNKIIAQTAVKASFTKGEDELLDGKMNKLDESQNSTKALMRQLMKMSSFTVAVARFIEQQATKSVASEATLRNDMTSEHPSRNK